MWLWVHHNPPGHAQVQEGVSPGPDPPPLLVLGEGGRQLQPPIGQCHGHVTTLHQSQLTWARSSAAPPAAARGSAAHGNLRTPATFCREGTLIYHAFETFLLFLERDALTLLVRGGLIQPPPTKYRYKSGYLGARTPQTYCLFLNMSEK